MTDSLVSRRTWLRGGSALLGGAAVSVPLGAVAFILIARSLTVAALGRYALVVALLSLVISLGTFRLETHLLLEFGAAKAEHQATMYALTVRAALLMMVPLGLVAAAGLTWWAELPPIVGGVLLLELLIQPILFARSVLQIRGRQHMIALCATLGRIIWLAWVAVLWSSGHASVPGLLLGRLVAVAVEAVALLGASNLSLWIGRPSGRLVQERQAIRASAPLAVSAFAGMTYNRSDQLVVTTLRGEVANGVYAAAAKLSELLRVIPTVVQNIVTPVLVLLVAEGRQEELNKVTRDATLLYLVPVSAVAVAGFPLASTAITLVVGPEYAAAANPLRLLLVAEVGVAFSTAVAQVVLAHDDRRLLARATLAGAILNVALTLPLVAVVGVAGAAAASAVTYVLTGIAVLVPSGLSAELRSNLIRPSATVAGCVGLGLATGYAVGPGPVGSLLSIITFVGGLAVLLRHDVRRVVRAVAP